MQKKYKLIIWDFNGTILDDTMVCLTAMNKVLSKRALPLLKDKEDFQSHFTFPVQEYYRRLGFDFSKEPYSVPADEWVELYDKEKFSSPAMEGIEASLKSIKEAGISQIVLSASEKDLLIKQLKNLKLDIYFDEILGIEDFYAHGKVDLCKAWLEQKDKNEIFPALFIGDTDHDYICSKEIGCDCILYSGGYMAAERISCLGVPVIDKISEVLKYVL